MKTTIACLFLFINAFAIAQKNYIKGVIITNDNDTIHGTINYLNWDKNPDAVQFVKEGTTEEISYKPIQIKAFIVATDYYESAIVAIDNSTKQLEHLSHSPDPVMVKDTVFLSAYVIGKVGLYYFKDKTDRKHFFIKKNNLMQELINNYFYFYNEGIDELIKSEKYKRQLIMEMDDCEGIIDDIKKLTYTSVELSRLFKKYNLCKNVTPLFVKKREKFIFEPTLIAGFSSTKFHFESTVPNYLQEAHFNRSSDLVFGIAVNIVIPRKRKALSLYNEFMYKSYGAKADVTTYFDSYTRFDKHYIFDFTYLKLVTLLRYIHPGKIFQPFFNIGITNGYAIKILNTQIVETTTAYNYRSYTIPAISDFRKYEQGAIGGVGVFYKHFSLEGRFEVGNGMSTTAYLYSTIKSYYLLLAFKF